MMMIRTNIVLIFGIFLPQVREKLDFRFGLHEKRLLRFDDFNGDFAMTLHIFGADNLTKGPLADALFDFVAPVKHFSLRDNVVVVLIVPAIVVGATGTLLRLLLLLFLL